MKSKMRRRIVITGTNCLTTLGMGKKVFCDKVFDKLLCNYEGYESKISNERKLEIAYYRCKDELFDSYLNGIDRRRTDRFAKMNIAVLQDLLKYEEKELLDMGYVMGTTFGTWNSTNKYVVSLIKEGPEFASPRLFPNTVLNAAQGHVAIAYKIKGPVTTITGINSIEYCCDLIQSGNINRIIAVGADECCENMIEAYTADANPIVMGEGIGCVVLEELEFAKARGANILCEIDSIQTQIDLTFNSSFKTENMELLRNMLNSAKITNKNRTGFVRGSNGVISIVQRENALLEFYKNEISTDIMDFAPKYHIGETFGASGILNAIFAAYLINDKKYAQAISLDYQIGGNQTLLLLKEYR